MRVVVDTNVLVSAALKEKSLPGMTAHIVAQSGVLLKSTTEREPFTTLARPRLAPLIPPRFRDWLSEVLAAAELVTITDRITACRDPKDDKFLELAVNGRADLIISGDADLLVLNPFREIPIVTPAAFVQGVVPYPAGEAKGAFSTANLLRWRAPSPTKRWRAWSPLSRGAGEGLCGCGLAAPLLHRGRGWRAQRDG
jgi:putative PIN family toxin of toxin-antitoxin system